MYAIFIYMARLLVSFQRFFKTPLLPFQTAAVKAWETLQTSHFDDIDDVDLTFA